MFIDFEQVVVAFMWVVIDFRRSVSVDAGVLKS